jgi:hypothetical protein
MAGKTKKKQTNKLWVCETHGPKKKKKNKNKNKTKQKQKQTVGLRRDPARRDRGSPVRTSEIWRGETRHDPLHNLPLPSSFFFLFSFFFNQLQHSLNFFLCIFFSLGEVAACDWWAKYSIFLSQPN